MTSYYEKNRDRLRARAKQRYAEKQGQITEQRRQWRASPEGIAARNAARAKKAEQARLRRDPAKARELHLKRYGLSVADFDSMLNDQGGVCAICREAASKICVDHCHKTGKVRGLLCDHCNRGIGCFGDDPETMASAIEYVRKNQ